VRSSELSLVVRSAWASLTASGTSSAQRSAKGPGLLRDLPTTASVTANKGSRIGKEEGGLPSRQTSPANQERQTNPPLTKRHSQAGLRAESTPLGTVATEDSSCPTFARRVMQK
jgi:hypothetical protein